MPRAAGRQQGHRRLGRRIERTHHHAHRVPLFRQFAVAVCEGEITGIGRVWADGQPINLGQFTHRIYLGGETQAPDSLIEAIQGNDNAPAYRGTAYIVFERLPLEPFGNRLRSSPSKCSAPSTASRSWSRR